MMKHVYILKVTVPEDKIFIENPILGVYETQKEAEKAAVLWLSDKDKQYNFGYDVPGSAPQIDDGDVLEGAIDALTIEKWMIGATSTYQTVTYIDIDNEGKHVYKQDDVNEPVVKLN